MKRIISLALIFVMLSAFSPIRPSAAEDIREPAPTVYKELEILDTRFWSADGGTVSLGSEEEGGLTFSFDSSDEGIVSFCGRFRPEVLSDFTELAFDMESSGRVAEYVITFSTRQEKSSVKHTPTGEESSFFVRLPDEVKDGLYSIRVDAKCESGAPVEIRLRSIIADTAYSYALPEMLNAYSVHSENELTIFEDGIFIRPENNRCSITFNAVKSFESTDRVLSWFTFSGADTGTIRAKVEDEMKNSSVLSSQTINQSGKYSFLSDGAFKTFTVYFESIPDGVTITVHRAGVIKLGEKETSCGNVSSCRWDGKRIVISGTVSNEASVQYSGSKLLVYTIPVSEADSFDLSDYSPAHTQGFSTKFKLSFVPERDHCEYFYKVVLDTEDGLMPIDTLTAPSSGTLAPVAASASSAIHGADAADVFDANFSNVILDVAIGGLCEEEYIYPAQRYMYSGKEYYFNSDVLTQLDSSIRFFDSALTGVYLRLFSDTDGRAFDYSADDTDGLSVLLATVSFLAERYPNLHGFIMGSAVNSDGIMLPEYIQSKARLICAFTEAVKSTVADARAVVPYASDADKDPFLCASMISYYLSYYKCGPIVTMYETSAEESAIAPGMARLFGIPVSFAAQSDGNAVFWRAPADSSPEGLADYYRELCVSGAAAGMHFTAVSVADTDRSDDLYSRLKEMLNGENVIPTRTYGYSASTGDRDFKGTYGIWDFTEAYDTFGWVSGGSFNTPFTASGISGDRVIRAERAESLGGSGILICRTEPSLDLSGLSARVTLTVSSETQASTRVCVVFSGGDTRAEFTATVPCNERVSLLCDLSAYEGAKKTDYAAVVVDGATDAAAELSKIELCSDTLDSEALKARFTTAGDHTYDPLLYATVIIVAAVTVIVFAALLKRQKRAKRIAAREDRDE